MEGGRGPGLGARLCVRMWELGESGWIVAWGEGRAGRDQKTDKAGIGMQMGMGKHAGVDPGSGREKGAAE